MTWRKQSSTRDGSNWERSNLSSSEGVGPVKIGSSNVGARNQGSSVAATVNGVASGGAIQQSSSDASDLARRVERFGAAKSSVERAPVTAATATVLGANSCFRGRLDLQGRAQIDGTVEGDIVVEGELIIGPTGVVKANIIATRAIISGRLTGDIRCEERLELRSGAYLTGDMAAPQVVMEDGVVFDGRCWMEREVVDEGLPGEFDSFDMVDEGQGLKPANRSAGAKKSPAIDSLGLDSKELEPS